MDKTVQCIAMGQMTLITRPRELEAGPAVEVTSEMADEVPKSASSAETKIGTPSKPNRQAVAAVLPPAEEQSH